MTEGFYRAGDGGYLDERGRLIFQGRINDIIKTGGANVSPVEVDWALCSCPGVKVCKTIGVPHATLGEMVVTLVAPEAGRALAPARCDRLPQGEARQLQGAAQGALRHAKRN